MVTKVKRAAQFSYFTGLNDESKKEAEAGLTSNLNEAIKASVNSETNQVARYYAKHDGVSQREAIGVYFVPAGSTPLFSNVKNGEAAKTFDIMKNGDGLDPETGVSVRSQNNRKMTSQGYDVMLAPPKAVSVLLSQAEAMAATGSGNEAKFAREMSDKIQTVLRTANNRAMQYIYDQGFFEVRYRDPDTKEDLRAGAADISAVQWQHFSSREGDPQAHFHNVFYNSGRRPDGSTGTIDNIRLLKNIHSVNAVFNAETIRGLAEIGISVTKDGHNYTVDGSVKSLETNFSKRSNKMLEVLKDQYGIDTRGDASAALKQAIVLATRNSKSELPELEQLIIRWGLEAKAEGHNLFTLLEGMKSATDLRFEKEAKEWAEKVEAAAAEGIELPSERPRFDMDEIRESAIKTLTENSATFEERQLNAAILEELSMFCGADEALGLLDELKQSDKIVHIDTVGRENIYSTPTIIALERDLMLRTMEMMEVRPSDRAVPDDIVEGIIAKGSISSATGERFDYRPDQALGIRYFAGAQRVALINGPPGAGKSAMMDGYVRTERACGRRVFGIAPTNRASIVLKNDAHIEAEHTRSVAGMIYDIESGKVQLGPNDVILCDEFGMVGLEDGAKLLKYVDEAGARFRGIGDQDQIQPVPFGASMRSMMHFVDTKFMVHISRQKGWMLDASYAFVAKDFEKGVGIYNEAGCVKLALSYDDMINRAVARHLGLLETNPGESHVIIARTNAEVLETNNRIRDELVARGALSGESVKFAAMSRGRKPYATEIELRAGDRIIMGDNIKVGSDKIANNAFGTVRAITPGVDGGEPRLVIEFENGFLWEGVPTELASQFNEESKDEKGNRIPHIALAYAMTIYAAQGLTADHSTLLNSVGMGRQTSLVGMTRARKSHELIADASRIVDKISARSGIDVQMNKRAATKEDDKDPEAEIQDAEILKELIKEMGEDEATKNVSDYQADKVAFAKGETKEDNKVISKAENETKAKAEDKAETKVEAQAAPAVTRSRVRGLGQFGAKVDPKADAKTNNKSIGEQLQEQMVERAASSDRRHMPKPSRPMPGTKRSFESKKTSDEQFKAERDILVKQNLAHYAEHDLKLKPGGVENAKGRLFHWFQAPDGGYLSIEQRTASLWTWVRRDGSAKGVIWDLVAEIRGTSVAKAITDLREQFRTREQVASSTPQDRKQRERTPDVVPESEVEKKTFVERMRETRAVKWTAERFAPIVDRFGKMKTVEQIGPSKLLLSRGIDERTQRAFGKDIRHEWNKSYLNPNGVAYPHKDLDGNIWTFARKGEKKEPWDPRSFSQMAGVSKEHADQVEQHRKRLGLMGNIIDPERIYVAESEVDGKSVYQLDRDAFEAGHGPAVPAEDKICIASTYGNPSYAGLDDLSILTGKNPNAEVHVCMDRDNAGRHLSGLVQQAVAAGRGDDAKVFERVSDDQFKDWNTQLMMKRTAEQIQTVWDRQPMAESGFLNSQGISVDLQKACKEDIRMETLRDQDGNVTQRSIDGLTNAGGVLVALRDRDLHITGYTRLGKEIDPTTALPFRRSESTDLNGVAVLGEHENPKAVYVSQFTMDALKEVEKDGCPEGFLILSAEAGADRGFNPMQKAVIQKFAAAHPNLQWNFIPEGTVLMHEKQAVKTEQAAAHMRMAIREVSPSIELQERVSASMLQPIPERKLEQAAEMQMSQDKSKDIQPEAPKPEVEEKVDQQPERRTTETVQRREPEAAPAPQVDTGAEAAAAQAAQEEEERRRRAQQQGMSM